MHTVFEDGSVRKLCQTRNICRSLGAASELCANCDCRQLGTAGGLCIAHKVRRSVGAACELI